MAESNLYPVSLFKKLVSEIVNEKARPGVSGPLWL